MRVALLAYEMLATDRGKVVVIVDVWLTCKAAVRGLLTVAISKGKCRGTCEQPRHGFF